MIIYMRSSNFAVLSRKHITEVYSWVGEHSEGETKAGVNERAYRKKTQNTKNKKSFNFNFL